VTIVEALDTILTGFDPDLVAVVRERLSHHGVGVLTGAAVDGDDGSAVHVTTADGPLRLAADRVLVAVGRVPNTDDLQLADAGLRPGPDGRLAVDAQQRTAVPSIFAIGDITAGPALAHKAMEEGRVAAEVIGGLPSAFDQLVPLLAFTDPELGAVGLTEAEARAEEGRRVVVGRARFAANGRAVTLDEPAGLVKVVADAETEIVLGVHLAGPSASDLVAEAALAVETAARLEDLARTVHPHPTLAEALADAARAARRRLERSRDSSA
jgi:dihydrolipoamide dehydrogenase